MKASEAELIRRLKRENRQYRKRPERGRMKTESMGRQLGLECRM